MTRTARTRQNKRRAYRQAALRAKRKVKHELLMMLGEEHVRPERPTVSQILLDGRMVRSGAYNNDGSKPYNRAQRRALLNQGHSELLSPNLQQAIAINKNRELQYPMQVRR